jgi:hypothetical protein
MDLFRESSYCMLLQAKKKHFEINIMTDFPVNISVYRNDCNIRQQSKKHTNNHTGNLLYPFQDRSSIKLAIALGLKGSVVCVLVQLDLTR